MATAVKRLCTLVRHSSNKPIVRKPRLLFPPFAPQQWRPFASSSAFLSEKSDEPGPRTAGPVDASAIEVENDAVEEADAEIQSLEEGRDDLIAAGAHGDVHGQIEHDDARRSALEDLERSVEGGRQSDDEMQSALQPPPTDFDPYDRGTIMGQIEHDSARRSALEDLERSVEAGRQSDAETVSALHPPISYVDPRDRDTIMRPPSSTYRSEEQGQTFWSGPLGDDYGEEDEFEEDDISSLGHGELEQHREMRDYARIAAWEMPLLSKLAKPFMSPTQATPLRFRTTDYMGAQHPASKKVVLEFCPADLPNLTPLQTTKFIKLSGARYNPSTEIVKMSCESFDTVAQNKRYLTDVVRKLTKEARDERDTFEDVPFDFRHHRPKRRLQFPEEWKITPERRRALLERRMERVRGEERRWDEERVVDGVRVVEKVLAARSLIAPVEAEALMVEAGRKGQASKGARGGQQQRVRL